MQMSFMGTILPNFGIVSLDQRLDQTYLNSPSKLLSGKLEMKHLLCFVLTSIDGALISTCSLMLVPLIIPWDDLWTLFTKIYQYNFIFRV